MMKSLIFFALVAGCLAMPQGFISDTPEVLAEKQRFVQLYNAAAAAAAAAPDIDIHFTPTQHRFDQSSVRHHQTHVPQTRFAPQAQVIPQAHHFAPQTHVYASKNSFIPHSTQTEFRYTGPVAETIAAGLPGSVSQVRYTAEVEAAIAEFTRAYNAAVVATTGTVQQPQQFRSTVNTGRFQAPSSFQSPQQFRAAAPDFQKPYTGPLASSIPAGLPGSPAQVAETADVQAAKAAFVRAYQQQLSHTLG